MQVSGTGLELRKEKLPLESGDAALGIVGCLTELVTVLAGVRLILGTDDPRIGCKPNDAVTAKTAPIAKNKMAHRSVPNKFQVLGIGLIIFIMSVLDCGVRDEGAEVFGLSAEKTETV